MSVAYRRGQRYRFVIDAFEWGRVFMPRRVRLLHGWIQEADRPTWSSFVSYALLGGALPTFEENPVAVGAGLNLGGNALFLHDAVLDNLAMPFPGELLTVWLLRARADAFAAFHFQPWVLGPGVPYEIPWARDPVVMQPNVDAATPPWRPRVLGIPENILRATHPAEAFLWTIWYQMEPVVLDYQPLPEILQAWDDDLPPSPELLPFRSPVLEPLERYHRVASGAPQL